MKLSLEKYEVVIDECYPALSEILGRRDFSKILVLVDENTKEHCWPLLKPHLPKEAQLLEIPAGETNKNIDTCKLIWQSMLEVEVDRKALMINLGGGVIGDMGGFCAATYKRGIAFMQMPTTLLSQVDASVGGKLGIDFAGFKNVVGLFQDPLVVLIDPKFLQTLPAREIRSGFSEIVKHALIADPGQWKELQQLQNLSTMDWGAWIKRSVLIKKAIVEHDPFEMNARKKLNFGHTIGHAVESHCLTTAHPLLHGEAVAWGMMAETILSLKVGLSTLEVDEILTWLQQIFQLPPLPKEQLPTLIPLMLNDKKNEAGRINFTMLKASGSSLINQTASQSEIISALERVNSFLQSD